MDGTRYNLLWKSKRLCSLRYLLNIASYKPPTWKRMQTRQVMFVILSNQFVLSIGARRDCHFICIADGLYRQENCSDVLPMILPRTASLTLCKKRVPCLCHTFVDITHAQNNDLPYDPPLPRDRFKTPHCVACPHWQYQSLRHCSHGRLPEAIVVCPSLHVPTALRPEPLPHHRLSS